MNFKVTLNFIDRKEAKQSLKELDYLLSENSETNRNLEGNYSVPQLQKLYIQLKDQISLR